MPHNGSTNIRPWSTALTGWFSKFPVSNLRNYSGPMWHSAAGQWWTNHSLGDNNHNGIQIKYLASNYFILYQIQINRIRKLKMHWKTGISKFTTLIDSIKIYYQCRYFCYFYIHISKIFCGKQCLYRNMNIVDLARKKPVCWPKKLKKIFSTM